MTNGPVSMTLFTTAKPFKGLHAVIQRNAVASWLAIAPRPEVLLIGDDEGTADVAAELGVIHVATPPSNEFGTPLVSGLFERAHDLAHGSVLVFLNADILLPPKWAEAIQVVADRYERFLVVGRRLDVAVTEPINFSDPSWASELEAKAAKDGRERGDLCIDWFAFSPSLFRDIPPFAIGRTRYDTWLVWDAAERGATVVDASAFVRGPPPRSRLRARGRQPCGLGRPRGSTGCRLNRSLEPCPLHRGRNRRHHVERRARSREFDAASSGPPEASDKSLSPVHSTLASPSPGAAERLSPAQRPSDAPAIPDRRPRLWPCPEHLPTSNTRRSRLSKTIRNRRPCNIRHSPREVGSREYFDDVEERKYFVEPHIPAFADFRSWAGKRVLEIGCGIGTDTINFPRAGAEVTAVDLSEASIEIARRRSEVFGLEDRVTFIHSNAETLEGVPLDPGYDLIYSFGVIHHTPRPDRVLQQAHRRLATGGTVKVMVYYRNSWKVGEIVLGYGKGRFWDLDALVARHSEAQTGCPVTFTYTKRTAIALFETAGLRVDKLEIDHIFPYRVKDYVEYRYVKRFPFNVLPERASAALEHTLGWHLCVTASAA